MRARELERSLPLRLRYLTKLTAENCLIFITSDGLKEESTSSPCLLGFGTVAIFR